MRPSAWSLPALLPYARGYNIAGTMLYGRWFHEVDRVARMPSPSAAGPYSRSTS